jgi:flagellar hook-associated protein 3 FlgL
MDLTINTSTQQFLNNLQITQTQMQTAASQVSSGLLLQEPSDDPSILGAIYQLQSTLAQNQQVQNNLASVGTQVSTADSAIESASLLLENAITIAAQGANSTSTAEGRSQMAQQVAGLQQSLVSITQTTVDGQFIFSGDQSTQPQYQLDPTQPNGVKQQFATSSTLVVQDVNGSPIATGKTAQEIFDAQDASGNPIAGNVFAAVNSLLVSLQNNDQNGIIQASSALQSADSYLNTQLAFYGNAENQIQSASSLAQKYQLQEQAQLSQTQDANIPAASLVLSQAQTQEQATLSSEANVEQTLSHNLFSYLG